MTQPGMHEGTFAGRAVCANDTRIYRYSGHYLRGEAVAFFRAGVWDFTDQYRGEVTGAVDADDRVDPEIVAAHIHDAARHAVQSGAFSEALTSRVVLNRYGLRAVPQRS